MLHRYPAVPAMLLACSILVIAGYVFLPLFYAVIIALAAAIVLGPVHRQLNQWIGIGWSALLLCIGSTIAIILFAASVINAIVTHGHLLMGMGNTIYAAVTGSTATTSFNSLSDLLPGSTNDISWTDQLMNETIPTLLSWIHDFAINLPSFGVQYLIFFLALFLILKNGPGVMSRLQVCLPDPTGSYVGKLARITSDTIYAVFMVNVQIAFLTFFITLPFFTVLGYGDPVFWSFICGASHLFPFFGPQIITLFLGTYALATGDYTRLLAIILIGYPLITGLADFFIRPKLLGTRTAVHPALMMIGLFGGMYTLGAVGIILGPLIIALALAAFETIMESLEGDENTR